MRRRTGKRIAGLETARDQLALFTGMPMAEQADYLMNSLEQAHDLPREIDGLVSAWQHGDTRWFEKEIESDFGRDPLLYRSLLADRNRRWIARIEKLLDDDQNYLVIVGTAHLVGRDGVIELAARDGVGAVQR